MRPHSGRRPAAGLTLVELLVTIVISAMILAALNSLVGLGLRAEVAGIDANEQAYSAGFMIDGVMSRLVSKTRAAPRKSLTAATADSTGDWLAPVMFCVRKNQTDLKETTVSDDKCKSGNVIASNVTAFSAQVLASTGPVDSPVITYSVTVAPSGPAAPLVVTASVRVGGGTQ